jgi:Flp pilus assembly protein TadG
VRALPPAPGGERGASAIELAMLTPVLIVVIFVTVQFALLFHARHVALAAAQAGARIARSTAATNPRWQEPARRKSFDYIRAIGPSLLERPSAVPLVRTDAAGNPVEVGVEVRGGAVPLVPFLNLRVTERSEGPVERFIPDT